MSRSHSKSSPSRSDRLDQRLTELERKQAELELELVRERSENQRLRVNNGRLQRLLEQLREENEKLKRESLRQATPFARRKRVEVRKKPGRKAGVGVFRRREKPHRVDRTRKAPLHGCPDCGGRLREIRQQEQYVTDIPKIRLVTTRYITYSGYCGKCHRRVRSHHPEQTSEATGAAGVMVGPRAKALAADLKHRLGCSYGKVSETLNDAFGLQVGRSGWCQADPSLAEKARPVYEDLLEVIRRSSVVHADETGWRIDTLSGWLWVFANQVATVYTIADNRSSDVVLEMLGEKFSGILVSDGFRAYDEKRLSEWLKQKCLAHLLRDLKDMQEVKRGGALRFARDGTALLKAALALKKDKPNLAPEDFARRAQELEERLDGLIARKRYLTDRDNRRFARRLHRHREHLLRFLYVDELDATNNLAERQLRPAVITRKTNGCNRSKDGAEVHSVLASVLATARQHSIPILDYLVSLQRYGETPLTLTAPP
jgi:predicted  nucleic acid-binding Zn-ribbon protein